VEAEAKELPSYWLPAFFDPRSFLGALIQARARDEGIPMHDLKNEFDILDIARNEAPAAEKHVTYLHGVSLEGAAWDADRNLVVDSTTTSRFTAFPALRARTVRVADTETNTTAGIAPPEEQTANFNANAVTKKPKKKKKGPPISEIPGEYNCPMYITTLRLSTGLISKDNAPVAYLPLPIRGPASKWIKRSVALILEAE